MTEYKIAVIRGDGIGVEVVEEGLKVLRAVAPILIVPATSIASIDSSSARAASSSAIGRRVYLFNKKLAVSSQFIEQRYYINLRFQIEVTSKVTTP